MLLCEHLKENFIVVVTNFIYATASTGILSKSHLFSFHLSMHAFLMFLWYCPYSLMDYSQTCFYFILLLLLTCSQCGP